MSSAAIVRLALLSDEPRALGAFDEAAAFFALRGEAEAERLSAAPWLGGLPTGHVVSLERRERLAPVEPRKILCVGRNYVEHAKELGNDVPKEPLLFLKPSSSLLAPGGTIRLPPESQKVEHEAELGVVIGRRARNVTEAEALAHVFGYTAVLDITARDLQRSDGQWSRAKGFDTFCPVGPCVVPGLDPRDLGIRCRVSGALRQDGRTSQMVFSVAALIAYASRMMTLEPGDLLVTGTPAGVGPLAPGDAVEVEIDGVGLLACRVAAS